MGRRLAKRHRRSPWRAQEVSAEFLAPPQCSCIAVGKSPVPTSCYICRHRSPALGVQWKAQSCCYLGANWYQNTSAGVPTRSRPCSSKLFPFAVPGGWQQRCCCSRNGHPAGPFPALHRASLPKCCQAHAAAGRGASLHAGSRKARKMQFLGTDKSHLCFSAVPLIEDNSTRFSNNIAKDKRTPFNAIW